MKKPKLSIRILSVKDAEEYSKIASGAEIHRYVPFMEKSTVTSASEWILSMNTDNEKVLGVFDKRTKRMVGAISISTFENELTVDMLIGTKYQNKGYGTEALLSLIKFVKLSKNNSIKSLIFEVHKTNKKSLSLQSSIRYVLMRETKNYQIFSMPV